MAALAEPGDAAHRTQQEGAGGSSVAEVLGRRFKEMDFDHDGPPPLWSCSSLPWLRACTRCGEASTVRAR